MNFSSTSFNPAPPAGSQVWESLKRAIAESSGFKSWQLERRAQRTEQSLDALVHQYLRDTLETLAY
jgi:hypothetical protein